MFKIKNPFILLILLLAISLVMKFFVLGFLDEQYPSWMRMLAIVLILFLGAFYVLRGTANVIEETTEVLHERTKLAGGLLQSIGTAFPDMVLGVVAAIVSLQLRSTDYALAINYAIIAASTTFGSNIYNIGHAAWCIYRQNLANAKNKVVLMFPGFKSGGKLKPLKDHKMKPSVGEFENAIDISVVLTILTALVAMGMVLFGRVTDAKLSMGSDLYKLIQPIGFIVFVLGIITLFYFRKSKRDVVATTKEIEKEEKFYKKKPNWQIWISLLLAGASILLAAESMVRSIEAFCAITGVPFVIAGVLSGIIGCLGEMIVVHNFSIHPNGRIGDAIIGVAMDNIVTIIGATFVAILGGIFLGGSALILIFVIILTLNSVLIWQISKLSHYKSK